MKFVTYFDFPNPNYFSIEYFSMLIRHLAKLFLVQVNFHIYFNKTQITVLFNFSINFLFENKKGTEFYEGLTQSNICIHVFMKLVLAQH